MNKSQMEMLSVKSAIERTVHSLVSSYSTAPDQEGLYTELCRYMAGLFASKQISNDYQVTIRGQSLEVRFITAGNISKLTFLLPSNMLPKASAPLESPILTFNR